MARKNVIRALAGTAGVLLVAGAAGPGAAAVTMEDSGDVQATVRKTLLQTATAEGEADQSTGQSSDVVFAEGPVVVREKTHPSSPMTVEQALDALELVGHDFYLFHDIDTDKPSVVYRRRGYDYGLIRLEMDEAGRAAS